MAPAISSMAAGRQQLEEELLSSCLELLNIKAAEGAKAVDICPSMFRKPNAKALELILYHAYCVIKGRAAAKKSLRGLWPLIDKDRKQSKEFFQKIQDWLKESGQLADHSLAAFQRNPAGPKLVCFLCDVAHWALEVQHAHNYPDDGGGGGMPIVEDAVLLAQLAEPLVTAAEAHNELELQRLLQVWQKAAEVEQQAQVMAAALKDSYYDITAQLRELQAKLGAQHPQPASIKLASILPAQLGTPGGTGDLPALQDMPAGLLKRQQEVQQLWQQLEAYMQEFEGLRALIQGLVGGAGHPHAIDAVQLRAHGHAGGFGVQPTATGAALDIAALVEAWLFDVGSVCRYVRTLAGHTASIEQQQDSQQRGWLPIRPGGICRCSFMSPLVATSDAASHATHLYAQLSLHRACREGLVGLSHTLNSQTEAAAARMQQLEDKLFPMYQQELAQAQDAADALAATGLWQVAASSADADAGGAHHALHADGSLVGPHLPQPSGVAPVASHLMPGGHLQLVPPTPMLQQLAKQQRRQQHQQAAEAHQGSLAANQDSCPQPPALPLHLPPGAAAVAVAPVAARSVSRYVHSPVQLLLPEAGHSPELSGSAGTNSPLSTASSSALPAAELLMSRELMDLDLVDDGDTDQMDDGGIFSTQHTFGRGGAGRSRGGAGNMARISFARFSLGTDMLSPVLAAAAGRLLEAQEEEEQQQQLEGGEGSLDTVPEPGEEDGAAGGSAGKQESWRSFGQAGQAVQSASPTFPAAQMVSNSSDGTAPVTRHSPAGGSSDAGGHEAPQGVNSTVASPAAAAAAKSSDAGAKSPGTAHHPPGLHDPLAPAALAGSAECLSSAKPRRLTFAAAASGHSQGSSALPGPSYDGDAALLDTASSLSNSSGEEGSDAAQSAAVVQQPMGADMLANLRQRFATNLMVGKKETCN